MTRPQGRRQWSPERERAREAERLKAMEREEQRRRLGPARKTKGVQTLAQEEVEEEARAQIGRDAGVEVEVWVPDCVRRAAAAASGGHGGQVGQGSEGQGSEGRGSEAARERRVAQAQAREHNLEIAHSRRHRARVQAQAAERRGRV